MEAEETRNACFSAQVDPSRTAKSRSCGESRLPGPFRPLAFVWCSGDILETLSAVLSTLLCLTELRTWALETQRKPFFGALAPRGPRAVTPANISPF